MAKKHFQIGQRACEKLAERFGTPLLVLSLDEIKKNYKVLKKYLSRVKIHYAIKANPHPEILRVMADMGSCFDVANDGEIRTLHDMGVDGGRLIYANPVKTGVGLEACRSCGVRNMTFDSASEIDKIKNSVRTRLYCSDCVSTIPRHMLI